VPYDSEPFSQTQPVRLAAIGHLFGLTPPDIETARVLELGCAAGGNLIPLAARYPDAEFVGVDYSGVQIAEGQARIAELGLKNIVLKQKDITTFTSADGQFDYIITHGIYSWVSEPVRNAILRISSENLTENGIAYISYNVLPGWHFVQPLRDVMLYHTQKITDLNLKVQQARLVLKTIKEHGSGMLAMMANNEENRPSYAKDYYLLHDHLEVDQAPCYFTTFIDHAQNYGLTYLTDVNFQQTIIKRVVTDEAAQIIQEYANHDPVRAEQYLDFFVNRRFRSTLLIKQSQKNHIQRKILIEKLGKLHFLCDQRIVKKLESDVPTTTFQMETTQFQGAGGAPNLFAHEPIVVKALEYLAASETACLATFTLEELANHATAPLKAADQDKQAIGNLLLQLLLDMSVTIYSSPMRGRLVTDKPAIFSLARSDAAHKRSSSATLLHKHLTIEKYLLLFPFVDGSRTHADLDKVALEYFHAGQLELKHNDLVLQPGEDAKEAARIYVQEMLSAMAEGGLLCEEPVRSKK
jgi:SAM-dependent methyltransferase